MASDDDTKAGFAGGQAGAFASLAEAAASHEVRVGMDAFRNVADRLENVTFEQSKGNLFEFIEVVRFNESAALSGSTARARVTAEVGRPHDPADIEIVDAGKIVRKIQAKVSKSHAEMAARLRPEKYEGMQRLVPSDAEERVRELTENRAKTGNIYAEEYADSAENLAGELHSEGVSSGGTTRAELKDAHAGPEWFAAKAELSAVARQAGKAGAAGAATGGAVALAFATVRQGYRFRRGDVDGREAVIEIAISTKDGAIRGGATGAGGAVISHAAAKVGAKSLAKSNIATTIAASTIDAGTAVYAFAKGEIDERELGERLGQNGVSTMASIYTGAAAGAALGPVGALVGSVAGYTIASNTFQSTMAILQQAQLAEEEARRLERLAEECITALEEQQRQILKNLEGIDQRREDWFRLLELYDASVLEGNPLLAVEATTNMACLVGVQLQFESFEEFDEFMSDPGSGPLVL